MRLSSKEQKNLQKNKPYKGFSRFRTDLSLVGLIFLFIIRGLNLNSSTHQSPELKYTAPTYSILWTKTLYKSLKFLFCIYKVVRRILTIRCWPADCYKLYSLISNLSVQFSF